MGRFGEEGIGANAYTIGNWIKGSHFTCSENAKADSISAYLSLASGTAKVKLAIYKHSDFSFVAETEEKDIGVLAGNWVEFNFNTPKPTLLAGVEYWLVAWSDNVGVKGYLEVSAAEEKFGAHQIAYDDWPETFDPFLYAYVTSIYCDYTPLPAAYPTGNLKKDVIHGYNCFTQAYVNAKIGGYDPLKLPDGTVF